MLAFPGENVFGFSSLTRSLDIEGEPCLEHKVIQPKFESALNCVNHSSASGSLNSPTGLLMECAANSGRSNILALETAEGIEAEHLSDAVLKSLDDTPDTFGSPTSKETVLSATSSSAMSSDIQASSALYANSPRNSVLPSGHTAPLVDLRRDNGAATPTFARPVHTASYDPMYNAPLFQTGSPHQVPELIYSPQVGRVIELGTDFRGMCEHIWRFNDQKTSLYLQERLRCCVPGEYEQLVEAVFENVMPLMVHRFGNFLVQRMLELSKPEEIAAFARLIEGRVAEMAKDQFCCHVIQRLLDVSPVVIQATIAAELLDDIVDTMCSVSGSHVWQKLLHIPWKEGIPPITLLANNAVHLEPNKGGWLTIASTEAGCATIKSFLGVSSAGPERQECLNELVDSLNVLIVDPIGSVLAARVAMIAASRARALTNILANVYDYAKHPVASGVLITLLHYKIPGFLSRLSNAIAPMRPELANSHYGKHVIAAIDHSQYRK